MCSAYKDTIYVQAYAYIKSKHYTSVHYTEFQVIEIFIEWEDRNVNILNVFPSFQCNLINTIHIDSMWFSGKHIIFG